MGTWKLFTGPPSDKPTTALCLSHLKKYDNNDYTQKEGFGSACPGFHTPVFQEKQPQESRKGISVDRRKQDSSHETYIDVIKKWEKNRRKTDSTPDSHNGAIWMSDTLCMDLNIPLAAEQPEWVTCQTLFLGEGLPPFVLTLYKKPANDTDTDFENAVKLYTMKTARLLFRLLHQFSTFCDFMLLPITLEEERFSEKVLEREITNRQKLSQLYYLGPQELNEYMFCELVQAVRALSSMSHVPGYLQSKPKDSIVCLERDWQKAVHDIMEKVVSGEDISFSIEGGDPFKVKVAVLEAARRLSFNHEVKLSTKSPEIKECVEKLRKKNKEDFDIDLQIEADSSHVQQTDSPEKTVIQVVHTDDTKSTPKRLVTSVKKKIPSVAQGSKRRLSEQHQFQSKKAKTEVASSSKEVETGKKAKTLDEHQQSVLKKWNQKTLFVNGGPGSGKTETLCRLMRKVQTKKNDSRVLVLSFNRKSVLEINRRLEKMHLTLLVGKDINDPTMFGCHVSTFDTFGYSVAATEDYKKNMKKKGYAELLEESAELLSETDPKSPKRCWDWVIVDEAQDVNFTHAFIVETLQKSCGHLVVAGDPRQELYSDCSWFAKEWGKHLNEESGVVLLYNHRSTPEIVDFLNTFSRKNFPEELHFDMKPAREGKSKPEVWQEDIKTKPNYGKQAAERLVLSKPEDTYAICPISVDAFNNKSTTNTIRQVVHDKNPGSITNVYSSLQMDENKQEDSYMIGTSRALKGSERNRVVVYGLTQTYMNYAGITKEAVQRSYFVALSRARDHLYVMLNGTFPGNNPLACFSKFRTYNSAKVPGPRDTTDIKNLSKDYKWNGEVIQLESLPPIEIDQKGDDDFVEEYLKTTLAKECSPENFKKKSQNPYELVAKAYSDEIGMKWTVSGRIAEETEKHRDKCEPYKKMILKLLKEEPVDWRLHKKRKVFTDGHKAKVGYLTGTFELSSLQSGVNLLYVDEIKLHHRQNAAMMAALWSFHAAYLMNLRTGETELVKSMDKIELKNLARLKLALEAKCQPGGPKLTVPDGLVKSCCVAVSEVVDPDTQLVMEIGAVAFSMDGTIRSTYQAVSKGVADVSLPCSFESDESEDETAYVASGTSLKQEKSAAAPGSKKIDKPSLVIVNAKTLQKNQEKSINKFCTWIKQISGRRCFLLSDDNVSKRLKLTDLGPAYDIQSMLNVKSSRSKMDSIQTLQEYTTAAFGNKFTYIPGRAFEDATAMSTLILKTDELK